MHSNKRFRPNLGNPRFKSPKNIDFKRKLPESRNVEPEGTDTSWLDRICVQECPLEKQLPLIISEIEEKAAFYKLVKVVCSDLKNVIRQMSQNRNDESSGMNVDVQPFGSGAMSLALKGSDVDLFVSYTGNNPDEYMKSIKTAMLRGRIFFRPFIIKARVPLIQCRHHSGIECDISFKNALGVCNTNLIQFILKSDERLRPFILLLKFIMKRGGLITSHGITSYCLIVLIIFFLQQLEKPLIPPVSHLQGRSEPESTVAGWNTSFSTDLNLFPKTKNDMSVPELLKGFFEFYSTFDFAFHMISTYTGKTYLKPIFADTDAIPNEFTCYKRNATVEKFEINKPMCVQGPFNHSHNISRNVTHKVLYQFQQTCLKNAKLIQGLFAGTGKYTLYSRLIRDTGKDVPEMQMNEIPLGQNVDFNCGPHCTADSLIKKSCESVLDVFKDILIKVYKCQVDTEVDENFAKRFSSTSSSSDSYRYLLHYKFSRFGLVSKIRKSARQDLEFPKTMSLINKEEIISNYMCDTTLKDVENEPLCFTVVYSVKTSPARLLFEYKSQNVTVQDVDALQSLQKGCMRILKSSI